MIQLYLFILHGESSEAGIMMKEREALGFTLEWKERNYSFTWNYLWLWYSIEMNPQSIDTKIN